MFTQEVNVEAMYRATELMFGDQAAMMLAKVADVIDRAQQDAYAAGKNEGLMELHDATEAAFDVGYTAGYDQGQGEAEMQAGVDINEVHIEAYDNGYLDGVNDARRLPSFADHTVQDILSVRAEAHYDALDEYDADNVQDSGDEQTYDPFRGRY